MKTTILVDFIYDASSKLVDLTHVERHNPIFEYMNNKERHKSAFYLAIPFGF
jgi:hypothetical protein